jgi:hypothetical protein
MRENWTPLASHNSFPFSQSSLGNLNVNSSLAIESLSQYGNQRDEGKFFWAMSALFHFSKNIVNKIHDQGKISNGRARFTPDTARRQ